MITSKVLACTPENLLSTYKEDAIGRNHFLYRFIHLLNCLEGSSIIALDGHWGSGKSFFVKQAKMVLDAHNPYIKHDTLVDKEEICKAWKEIAHSMGGKELSLKKHVCVYYDSWLHDDDEDPLALGIRFKPKKIHSQSCGGTPVTFLNTREKYRLS